MLSLPRLLQIQNLPLLQAVNHSEPSRNCFRKIRHFCGRGYLKPLVLGKYLITLQIIVLQHQFLSTPVLKTLTNSVFNMITSPYQIGLDFYGSNTLTTRSRK